MKTAHVAKKKRISTGLVLLAASLVLACGITMAYMFTKSAPAVNEFEKATVSCQVQEAFDGTEKSRIAVQNTSNIPAYLRVRLVSYWVNGQDEIMAKPSAMPEFTLAEGWVAQGDNTYCYSRVVPVGGATPDLLAEGSVITLREEDGFFQVVEVFADAIQGAPADAVEESWKVTVNDDGVITGPQAAE